MVNITNRILQFRMFRLVCPDAKKSTKSKLCWDDLDLPTKSNIYTLLEKIDNDNQCYAYQENNVTIIRFLTNHGYDIMIIAYI